MSTNYWLEQYNKEVLAKEIKSYLDDKHGTPHARTNLHQLTQDTLSYLNTHNKKYKIYLDVAPSGELVIQIP